MTAFELAKSSNIKHFAKKKVTFGQPYITIFIDFDVLITDWSPKKPLTSVFK